MNEVNVVVVVVVAVAVAVVVVVVVPSELVQVLPAHPIVLVISTALKCATATTIEAIQSKLITNTTAEIVRLFIHFHLQEPEILGLATLLGAPLAGRSPIGPSNGSMPLWVLMQPL
jgi:hypothetical protein